jgi:GNAT superfamily N-acetyltransferase
MIEIEAGCNGRLGLASLDPSDTELAVRLFHRLSPESVYRRFHSPVVRAEYFTSLLLRLDHHEREAVAAVEDGELVGVAQYSRPAGSVHADLAIVVADAWQRQGLGTRLVAALAERAKAEGITGFTVDVQGDNVGVLKLLKRIAPGLRLVFSGGVGEGVIPLPAERAS